MEQFFYNNKKEQQYYSKFSNLLYRIFKIKKYIFLYKWITTILLNQVIAVLL